jgi:hypothetical protein
MRRIALALLAACGDNAAPPAPVPDAAPPGCAAAFTGAFAETSSSPANCPTLGSGTLDFAVPIAALGATLDVSIALPAVEPGTYSSETIARWSAMALERQGDGGCVYRAGNGATPQGSFMLSLASVAPPGGMLALALPVLTLPGSTCGSADVEMAAILF